MSKANQNPWQGKIINRTALGGIETSVMDNGLERGVRIAWINTGTGLRYKVAIDRGLDIVDAFYNQYALSWYTHAGLTAPKPDANRGLEWLYSFPGGMMTTCGLTHIGGPEANDEAEPRGLHGRYSNIPAELLSIEQPDPFTGKLDMSITAVIKESRLFGTNLELRRTISSRLGEARIKVKDVVTNYGNMNCPHMILYHCNFGWPLVDEGADILWKGSCQTRGSENDTAIFNEKNNYRKCSAPLESHRGSGESCGFIDVTADKKGLCTVGLHNSKLNLAVEMCYPKKQLPCLTNWQHWGFNDYVTALEPGTNPPTGQNKARQDKTLIMLKPGQSKTYELEFIIHTEAAAIKDFVARATK